MTRQSPVTLCVPVYNGDTFVAETLAAIAGQSYGNLTVLVSDDGSDDRSLDVCRHFATDPRIRLSRRPSRLGWIAHCNWLLAQADGDFVGIVSHDDLPEPDYAARLVAILDARPECALAFSDIRVFGLLAHEEHQPSIVGTGPERVRAFIASHFDGTAFHGLIRRSAVVAAGGLRGNASDHFAADVAWLGRLARFGQFERVAEPLYRKRRHATSTSMQWGRWSEQEQAEAWCLHCRELLQDALAQPMTLDEQRRVVRAALRRALAIEPVLPFGFIRDLPPVRQSALAAALVTGLAGIDTEVMEETISHASDATL